MKKVLEVGKVLPRGQLTLPKSVRQAANIEPGNVIAIEVLGDGRVEIRVLSRMSLEEAFARFKVDAPYDDDAIREQWQAEAAREFLRE